VTPEERAEAERFRDAPVAPEAQARSDAMVALAETFRERAEAKATEVRNLMETEPAAVAALDALWDVVAAELARCTALDCGSVTIEQALRLYGLEPSIAVRAEQMRSASTN
jgi:hypothetical protein